MKAQPRVEELTLRVRRAPRIPPHMDAAAKQRTIAPASAVISKCPPKARESRPQAAVISMMSKDVAEAFFMG